MTRQDWLLLVVGGGAIVILGLLWDAVAHLKRIDEAIEALRRRWAPDELEQELDAESD